MDAVVEITNFSLSKFWAIWSVLSDKVQMDWKRSRTKATAQTAGRVFMLLCTFKHADTWDFNVKMFDIKGPTLVCMILGVSDGLYDTLYSLAAQKYEKRYRRGSPIKDGTTFRRYKFAHSATGVKFQHIDRPAGIQEEPKVYFINKHKLYWYRSEVCRLLNGLAIGCTPPKLGSESDIKIFRNNLVGHQEALSSKESEADKFVDVGPTA